MAVKKGDKIKIEYTGKLDDGTVFDSSENKEPLEFTVGSNEIIKGVDEAVVGMEKGEEKEIDVSPEEAYGPYNADMKQKVPKESLPKDQEIKPGMRMIAQSQNGQKIPVKVDDVDEKEVTLDLNHPLAGKKLNFKIKVVEMPE